MLERFTKPIDWLTLSCMQPTFVFFKDGQEKGKVSGADPYHLKEMLDELK